MVLYSCESGLVNTLYLIVKNCNPQISKNGYHIKANYIFV